MLNLKDSKNGIGKGPNIKIISLLRPVTSCKLRLKKDTSYNRMRIFIL